MFAIAAVLLNVDAAFACSLKWRAYATTLKSDLRNLVLAEEAFFEDHHRYSPDLEALSFRTSTGVASVIVNVVNDSIWSATATHTQLPGACYIYVGARPSALRPPAAVKEGEPWCVDVHPEPRSASPLVVLATWFFVIALAFAARFFLSIRGRRNWALRGLVAVSMVSTVMLLGPRLSFCGAPTPLSWVLTFLAMGLGLFTLALRRRIVPA